MTNVLHLPMHTIRKFCRISFFLLVGSLHIAGMSADDTILVSTPLVKVLFSPDGGILSVTPSYQQTKNRTIKETFTTTDSSLLLRVHVSPVMHRFTFNTVTEKNDSVTVVVFGNDLYELSYVLYADNYAIDASLQPINKEQAAVPPSVNNIRFEVSRHFDRSVHSICVKKRREINLDNKRSHSDALSDVSWFGIRNRFWTFLVNPTGTGSTLEVTDRSFYTTASPASLPLSFRVYAGPVEYRELHKADRDCTYLLYPLWFWMRRLTIGLLQIFTTLLHLSGNTVLSIALLSVCVKIIIAPLFAIANRWQRKVNRQKSLLEPRLREIRQKFKGEERNARTLDLYKETGISPLYSLKSLLSAAIQIPVFFAAYHMLNEHIALQGVPFLWIEDCSYPDHFYKLPFSLFFLGNHLNILPFVMTAVTIAASCIHTDRSLSATLHKQQRKSLLIMATLFFLLLYASSAGMLIYWTMNNLLALLMTVMKSILHSKKSADSTKVILS